MNHVLERQDGGVIDALAAAADYFDNRMDCDYVEGQWVRECIGAAAEPQPASQGVSVFAFVTVLFIIVLAAVLLDAAY